jgi:hypothetical protein
MTVIMMSCPWGSVAFAIHRESPQPVAADYAEFALSDSTPFWSRQFTRTFLSRYEIPSDAADLVVSELATNAVQASRKLGRLTTVGLSLRLFYDHLLIEVVDSSPEIPMLIDSGDYAEGGRGLHLVDALTDRRWGWFPWGSRKVVFARLLDAPEDASREI